MQRKLTITIADDVHQGLHQKVGRGEISRFIEILVRPHVTTDTSLEDEYRSAARDTELEREAIAWIEANVDEALDVVRRGAVYWVDFDPARGGEIQIRRPAVLVSNEAAIRMQNRIHIVPLTSNTARIYRWEALSP